MNPASTKFALRTPTGLATALMLVNTTIPALTTTSPPPGHLILVVDRSGSMYSDMDSVRETIDRLTAAGDMTSLKLKVTLLSYSSSGDLTSHFSSIDIGNAANDPVYKREVSRLRATGLTSPSQALRKALEMVQKATGEAVTVLLHSDGYANDPGIRSEQQACLELAGQIAAAGAVVSTVAHRDWSDFTFLSQVAAKGGGTCLRASDTKQLYKALADTASAAAGRTIPTLRLPLGNAEAAIAVDVAGKRVISAQKPSQELVIQGLSQAPTVYFYTSTTEQAFDATPCASNAQPAAALAYALAALNNNDKVSYQRALVGSQVEQVQTFWRAVSSQDIGDAAEALSNALFSGQPLTLRADPGVVPPGPAIMDILAVLHDHRRDVLVHVPSLRSGYVTRSLKRKAGTIVDGQVKPFPYAQRARDEWAHLNGVDVNRGAPNVNLNLRRKAALVQLDENEKEVREIREVAGIPLDDFSEFKNYTVIGEGSVYLRTIKVRLLSKQAHAALRDLGVPVGDFSPAAEIDLDLGKLAVIGTEPTGQGLDERSLTSLFEAQMLEKALGAMTEGESTRYDAPTVEKLREYGISGNLYFSAPTVASYAHLDADKNEALKKALSSGLVDTRVTYNVTVGTKDLVDPSDLMSGNKFLDRRFEREDGKGAPKMTDVAQGVKMREKTLTGRTKLTAVDDMAFPLFRDLLGLGDGKALQRVVAWCERDSAEAEALVSTLRTALASNNRDAVSSATFKLLSVVSRAIETFYRRYVSPVVLFAGATGTVPSAMAGKTLTADEVAAMGVKLSKALVAEGSFFLTDRGVLISVLAEQVYYTPQKQAA